MISRFDKPFAILANVYPSSPVVPARETRQPKEVRLQGSIVSPMHGSNAEQWYDISGGRGQPTKPISQSVDIYAKSRDGCRLPVDFQRSGNTCHCDNPGVWVKLDEKMTILWYAVVEADNLKQYQIVQCRCRCEHISLVRLEPEELAEMPDQGAELVVHLCGPNVCGTRRGIHFVAILHRGTQQPNMNRPLSLA